jgi:hypothetical protein
MCSQTKAMAAHANGALLCQIISANNFNHCNWWCFGLCCSKAAIGTVNLSITQLPWPMVAGYGTA